MVARRYHTSTVNGSSSLTNLQKQRVSHFQRHKRTRNRARQQEEERGVKWCVLVHQALIFWRWNKTTAFEVNIFAYLMYFTKLLIIERLSRLKSFQKNKKD